MAGLLIVDECLPNRLATELARRGYPTLRPGELGFKGKIDTIALTIIERDVHEPYTLVTADDIMPWEHGEQLRAMAATVATVEGEWESMCKRRDIKLGLDAFRRESVHRWAHLIASQTDATVVRYSPWSHSPWKVRRQHVKRIPTPELYAAGGQGA